MLHERAVRRLWRRGFCPQNNQSAHEQGRVRARYESVAGPESRLHQQHRKRRELSVHGNILLHLRVSGRDSRGVLRRGERPSGQGSRAGRGRAAPERRPDRLPDRHRPGAEITRLPIKKTMRRAAEKCPFGGAKFWKNRPFGPASPSLDERFCV